MRTLTLTVLKIIISYTFNLNNILKNFILITFSKLHLFVFVDS